VKRRYGNNELSVGVMEAHWSTNFNPST